MGSGNDGVSYGGSSTVTINAGSGDDYIEIVGTGSATVDAGSGNDFIIHNVQNGIAGSAVINGGSGIDKIIGGISTDQIYGDEGDDDISGPAKRIDAGSGADLVTFEMEDQLIDSHISLGGNSSDQLDLWGTVGNDQVKIEEKDAQLGVFRRHELTVDRSVFKVYAAGSDEVKIDGVKTTGLDQFTIDLGQRLIQQGTTTETETIGSGDEAQTFTREIPNYVFNPDGASDSIVFVGSSLNDDFAISSSGQIEGGGYTSFDVRASGNLNYRVTIENSIRSEGDQLTLNLCR